MSNVTCQVKVGLETWVSNGIVTDLKFTADKDDCPYFIMNSRMPNDFEVDPGSEAYTCLAKTDAINGQCPHFLGIRNTRDGVVVTCNGLKKEVA